jgi:hypothetical protein
MTNRERWLAIGIERGFCSPAYCDTHDGPPMTELEQSQFEEGHDPCLIAIRLGNKSEWQSDATDYQNITNDYRGETQ